MVRSTPLAGGRRRGVCRWALASIVTTLFAGLAPLRPAHASSGLALELDDLARRASLVVRARVLAKTASWDAAHRRISTRVELQVLERLKGAAPRVVVAVLPGGELDGIVQRVEGTPAWTLGEEAVVFLHAEPRGDARVVGLSQGKWRVVGAGPGARVTPEPSSGLVLVDPRTRAVVPSPLAATTLARLRRSVVAASLADRRAP